MALQRNSESYIAGAVPLNRNGPRYSADIDIFHDQEASVASAAEADAALLTKASFDLKWIRREPGLYVALIARGNESMRLEWVRDSDFRFFPILPDKTFGYMLHVIDIATNKVLAAAGRREPCDVLDLLTIHDHYVRLGAVIWAAVSKDPGYSPENLISEIKPPRGRSSVWIKSEGLAPTQQRGTRAPSLLSVPGALDPASYGLFAAPAEVDAWPGTAHDGGAGLNPVNKR